MAKRNLLAVVATAAVALFSADSALGVEPNQIRIVVHVTDNWLLQPAVLASVEADVAAIYDRIGVDVVWATPDCSENDAHNFAVLILSPEMGLKMIATDRVGPNVMGLALRAAKRAYIFTHRVHAVSASELFDFPKLLGQVIAHEIGHLLLTNGHSAFGIMQPAMQLLTNRAEWFTPAQGARIRAELAGATN